MSQHNHHTVKPYHQAVALARFLYLDKKLFPGITGRLIRYSDRSIFMQQGAFSCAIFQFAFLVSIFLTQRENFF